MRMKKYLLYAWIVSAFCSCSENSMEPLPIEVDADCVDIVNDESFVPVSQATEVAGLFLAANGKDAVTTRNGSIEPDACSGKTVKDKTKQINNPPTIIIAKGFWISDPIPVDKAAGNNPKDPIKAIINIDRIRLLTPNIIAWRSELNLR